MRRRTNEGEEFHDRCSGGCWYCRLYSNSFQNLKLSLKYEYLLLLTTFSAFSDLVDLKHWGCLHFRFLRPLTLFPLCFFHFPLNFFSDKKESCSFSVVYFIGIFTAGLNNFKSLDEVISLWEVSEESIVLRVLKVGSADTGITFWEMKLKKSLHKLQPYLEVLFP